MSRASGARKPLPVVFCQVCRSGSYAQEGQWETDFVLLSSPGSLAAGPETVKRYLPQSYKQNTEENTLPFVTFPRSVCLLLSVTWKIGSLFRQLPVWSHIAMDVTLMDDRYSVGIAKGSGPDRGEIPEFFYSCMRKVKLLSLIIFWNWETWWLNPSFYIRDECIS